MIRIDEIYQNVFWEWVKQNTNGVRLLYCYPFGKSGPDDVATLSNKEWYDNNYIVLFDQEPIHLDIHTATFDKVVSNNQDIHLNHYTDRKTNKFIKYIPRSNEFKGPGMLVTSELNSNNVNALCEKYNWRAYYYFFHGWAALDWYRGYDKTFLIKPIRERAPTKTFIAPNRIIAGERKHRLEMLYHIFKHKLTDNHISCPAVCPAENISIVEAAKPLLSVYPDIQDVFAAQQLPINFAGETDSPMHSCWLSLFDEAADSLLYLVTETVADGRRHHLTEKTFKPIAMGMPFVLVATAGSLEYLRSYGFKTFGHVWDESYDTVEDPHERIRAVAKLLKDLHSLSHAERVSLFHRAIPVIEHNWNHFYGGHFEAILWDELQSMLKAIHAESRI